MPRDTPTTASSFDDAVAPSDGVEDHASTENAASCEQDQETAASPEAADAEEVDLSHLTEAERVRLEELNKVRVELHLQTVIETGKHAAAVGRVQAAREQWRQAILSQQEAIAEINRAGPEREAALANRTELEDRLREVNAEREELLATPEEKAERERRRQKKAAAEAARAEREAYLDELVPFEMPYWRVTDHNGKPTGSWGNVGRGQQHIKVRRRDLPRHEAELTEARAYFAKVARDQLADEYIDHCRYERATWWRSEREKVEYLSKWGPDRPHAVAYRERQREQGRPEADPPRAKRDTPFFRSL